MIQTDRIAPDHFVELVTPLLEKKDVGGLVQLLKSKCNGGQLNELLHSDHLDARKVALLAMGLVGGKCCIEMLAEQLKDTDPVVNELAEHSLWAVWFRCGTSQAVHELGRGVQALNEREYQHAISHFNRAIEGDPDCFEAYNQRALAWYSTDNFENSILDCRKAVDRMPCHFAAWAGMGHCYMNLCCYTDAIKCYQRALDINPHLQQVSELIDELKRQMEE